MISLGPGPDDRESVNCVAEHRRIIVNAALNVAGQMTFVAVQLGVVFFLARGLGKSAMGAYYALFAGVLIVQLTVEAGAGTLVTRRVAQDLDRSQRLVSEGFGLFLVIAVASFVAIAVPGVLWAVVTGGTALLPAIIAAAVACAAIQLQRFAYAVLQAFERVGFENFMRGLQAVTFLAAIAGLFHLQIASVNSVLAMLALSHVLAGIASLCRLRGVHPLTARFAPSEVFALWRSALPLGCGDVIRKLTWQIDTVFLALLQPPAAVGIYNIAYRPLGPLNWLPRTVLTAAFPAVARTATLDRGALAIGFSRGTRLLLLIGLPIAISLQAMAEPLIHLLAGAEYDQAVPLFELLVWVVVFSFVSQQYRFLLTALDRQNIFTRLALFVLLLKGCCQFLLIPYAGCWGACLGTFVAEVIFTLGGIVTLHQLRVLTFPWKEVRACLAAGAGMASLAWLGRGLDLDRQLLWMIVANGFYFGLCYVFGGLPAGEARRIIDALRPNVKRNAQLST